MLKKITAITLSGLMLLGCSSKPEPVDLSTASPAYNKAYGTYLTEPYSFGGRTYNSPLRDFSPEEVKEIEKEFAKRSGGNASILFGSLAILTGNFTGVIDVVGGTAANISSSKHPSSRSGWVVSIGASEVKDGIEAKAIATHTIQTAAVNLLRAKGNKIERVVTKKARLATFTGAKNLPKTTYQLNDEIMYGMFNNHAYDDDRGFELNADKSAYVVTGDTYFGGVNVANFIAFDKGYVKGYDGLAGYEQFMEDLTASLPDNYMYYSSTLPQGVIIKPKNKVKIDWSCSDCFDREYFTLTTHIIPSLYYKGKRYEFIKSAK